ncbi:MAG: dienelactone hydrolase family protein [Betaproteobacteria bacterium]|nr:dienelactone hydrolase family protein [Betaproteobacteria bacterium]
MKQVLAAFAAGLAGFAWAGGVAVAFPGPGLELAGRLYRPAGEGPFPAIVMLHGCTGLWAKSGEPTASFVFWAEHFRSRGYVTLLLDSFGPRGEREICTQIHRKVSETRDRPKDAYAALGWLASRKDVDPGHIHVMGWSNGAMAVLHVLRPDAPGREAGGPRFRSAVAFYPGCAALARTEFRPTAPLLIQSGGADDWTPAHHCEALAGKAPQGLVEIDVYPGAFHSFDRLDQPIRERSEVRNPNRAAGRGATVGTNREARDKAIARTTGWLEERNR